MPPGGSNPVLGGQGFIQMAQIHPPTMPQHAGWTVPEIRAALALKSLNANRIAKQSGFTFASIRHAINGSRQGLGARIAVAEAIGVPVTVIWPDAEHLRRCVRKPKQAA